MTTRRRQALPQSPVSSSHDDNPTPVSRDRELRALQREVAALCAERDAQRHEIAALRAEMDARLAALQAAITVASSAPGDAALVASARATTVDDAGVTITTSRRSLLKWGGLGAAAALAAAGGTALTAQTAHAADGGNLVLGQANTAEHTTSLSYDGSETAPAALTVSTLGYDDSAGITVTAGSAVNGAAFGINCSAGNGGEAFGLYAAAGTDGNAVFGFGTGSAAFGVCGESDTGYGVVARSFSGIDLSIDGAGRVWQRIQTFGGAPTTGSYNQGEQLRDHNGDLYLCIASGSPGVWRKVAAGIPGVSGAINFLANPIRLLDTRTGSPWTAGSTHTLQVTGVTVSGLSVPGGAIGVVGNVTVVSPSAGGDLRLYPGGSAPNTSSINFAANQIIANGVIVGLNSGGQLNIKVDMPTSAHTHVLFDTSGYIL